MLAINDNDQHRNLFQEAFLELVRRKGKGT